MSLYYFIEKNFNWEEMPLPQPQTSYQRLAGPIFSI